MHYMLSKIIPQISTKLVAVHQRSGSATATVFVSDLCRDYRLFAYLLVI